MGPVRLVNKGEIERWLELAVERESDKEVNQEPAGAMTHPFRSRADCICNAGFCMGFGSDPVHQHYIINNHGILIGTGPYSPLIAGGRWPVPRQTWALGDERIACLLLSFSYAWRQLVCRFFEVSQKYAT